MAIQLNQDQFYVTRKKGTEPPFSGEYEDTEAPGTYVCVCCGQPLFIVPRPNIIRVRGGPAIGSRSPRKTWKWNATEATEWRAPEVLCSRATRTWGTCLKTDRSRRGFASALTQALQLIEGRRTEKVSDPSGMAQSQWAADDLKSAVPILITVEAFPAA